MKRFPLFVLICCVSSSLFGQQSLVDVPYANSTSEKQKLDIYTPASAISAPVVFWIHGGGWQTGDKSEVDYKPELFTKLGYLFVSINYRLLPEVEMEDILHDVAMSFRWVQDNIAPHGGDPKRIILMGHSAGAQLAALICTDQAYLESERVSLTVIRGCIPIDGDTYDIPAIITTAETRRRVHGLPQSSFGHREKFGNDEAKHSNFSAVSHIKKGKQIPPFLILYVGGHPDTSAQAQRLANSLSNASVPVELFAAKDTDHIRLNRDLGTDNDSTSAVTAWLDSIVSNPKSPSLGVE